MLLKDKALPPLKWSLGSITHLHPGPEKVVLVVNIRTAARLAKHAINKFSLLPIASSY